ncbi:LysR family transcriptional regulator [Teichococcus oryzae]|uniref:LysR family transcriptional regulator n=1 Tax=Teichococcus oryzae TaxID=1608942 RepID=A0A5B2TCY5_9PROT|nr:LysR family transcriptional regulator [Pseudoroseomonas oryzae]KAA2212376.1 LysR family transcriptional regulator [Pseudoroseomonas oryzae]
MELRHLRYFVAVAEELNMTRAAARLGLAQPPLSQQMQQLERLVGVTLFHRLPRGVALTEAGQRLLRDARSILAQLDQAADNARAAARGELGTIRIGFTSSASFNPFVTRVIRDFRAEFPQVGVQLMEENTAALLARFRVLQLDAAFIRPAAAETEGLEEEVLFHEEMLVALPVGHRLEAWSAVPLAELATETFILYPRRNGSALYDAIVGGCLAAGFSPQIGQEAPQMGSTVTLVAAGIGISIVPASMRHLHTPGVTYRPIEGDAPRAPMSLVLQRRAAPAVTAAFRDLVRSRLHTA